MPEGRQNVHDSFMWLVSAHSASSKGTEIPFGISLYEKVNVPNCSRKSTDVIEIISMDIESTSIELSLSTIFRGKLFEFRDSDSRSV